MNKEEKEKKYYELGFLSLVEEIDFLKDIFSNLGIEILTSNELVKVNLAYPIKKVNQAFFGYFYFLSEPDKILELDQALKMNSNILRFMILKLSKHQILNYFKNLKEKEKDENKEEKEKSGDFFDSKILTNEVLEKKIEEILS